jgi:hypothetical protein
MPAIPGPLPSIAETGGADRFARSAPFLLPRDIRLVRCHVCLSISLIWSSVCLVFPGKTTMKSDYIVRAE